MTDVSVIVNLHREGRICEATFESVLAAVRLAKDHGTSLEIISIVDNGDADTLDAVGRYDKFIKIHECRLGDLSQARNFGVSVSSGKFVTFIDGDDLWGKEWLVRCLDTIKKYSNEKVIIHPQLNLYFGKNTKSNFWIHADMIADKTDLVDIFISNRWTALCFAGREVFENFPYVRNEINNGFGYEDWLWHIQTAVDGYKHVTAEQTCHFIRRKSRGSLLSETNSHNSLPNIQKLGNLNVLKRKLMELLVQN